MCEGWIILFSLSLSGSIVQRVCLLGSISLHIFGAYVIIDVAGNASILSICLSKLFDNRKYYCFYLCDYVYIMIEKQLDKALRLNWHKQREMKCSIISQLCTKENKILIQVWYINFKRFNVNMVYFSPRLSFISLFNLSLLLISWFQRQGRSSKDIPAKHFRR